MKLGNLNCCVLLIALVTLSATASGEQSNQLSEAEKKSGWQLLFDGESTDGWRNYKADTVSKGWSIVDGALTRSARGAGDIITTKQYDSFELSIEYKISKAGNSGIMYHVSETEPRPWHTGPEIQIQDNVDGHDPQKSGWLYQLYPARVDATRPAGEWNHLHIRITPDDCEHHMNGIRYVSYVKGSPDWRRRVARSKFSKMPNFGKASKGHICLQDHGNLVAYRNIKIRELNGSVSTNPVDGALPIKAVAAFEKMQWTGWSPISDAGLPQDFRPIVLTNAADGSNRIFVATQRGVIHSFKPGDKATKIFLNIEDRVSYKDRENEEGLLGLAFHPKFKDNGELFIYYTTSRARHTSVVSRFRVGKNGLGDPGSEEEIWRAKQPYWNHNGGTICFGPEGYLYIGLGDGGSANDPLDNGQNLSTQLGSILRIDVDRKSGSRSYAIPDDNPFVGRKDAAGEIYAYGLRNVWRMSFDRKNGQLWAADVGQNLWEEINIITKGGNYGWNLREASHSFGKNGVGSRSDLIEPIWEYDHTAGKSITGGVVYRGKRLPSLNGWYLYADYVTNHLWALHYDKADGGVISNKSIARPDQLPVISFGEDEQGEVYFTVVSSNGGGIYTLAPQ